MPSRAIVLDTNVLVSAAIKEGTPPAVLLTEILRENVIAITCPEIVSEYLEVFQRPKFKKWKFPPLWLDVFLENAIHLEKNPPIWPFTGPDRDDLFFLSLAHRQNATLVTGNLKDFPEKIRSVERGRSRLKVEVVDVSTYLDWLYRSEE